MTERITFIDFGRVVSIFCVIILHVCLGGYYLFSLKYDLNWSVTLFYYTLSRVSVPVFVMISGVTTIWLKKQCNQVVTVSSALYRISKLIIPIFFFGLLYICYYLISTPPSLYLKFYGLRKG
ncbi:acyltransferase family protein [Escherichia coli]|uniref:acyltransferase family protein n=1 Tax=Escherichia coli TaxID=562 RepID=UPI00090702B0